MKRVGFLLCGCGVYDGSEVQEAVLLTLALHRRGMRSIPIAPDVEQRDLVDHTTGSSVENPSPRSVLLESARVTRGSIRPLSEVLPAELDALVVPGGIGVVKNLCLPGNGPLGVGPVRPEVASLLSGLRARGAPIALVGLARALAERADGGAVDPAALAVGPGEVVVDRARGWLFTPGFMASDSIVAVAEGIDRLADEIARRVGAKTLHEIGRGPGTAPR